MQPAERIFMGLRSCNMRDMQYLSQSVVTVCVSKGTQIPEFVLGGLIFIIHMTFHPVRDQ